MASDIEKARRWRIRARRRALRQQWLDQVSIEVSAQWPRGLLGALVGTLFLLMPPLFIWLGVRIVQWAKRSPNKESPDDMGA